jgi:transcriptional regulator of acetoin/glycerol metabolism
LENVIYHAMIISESKSIEKESLPKELKTESTEIGETDSSVSATDVSIATGILPWKEVEKQTIAKALKIAGSIPKAAKALGISRSTFYRMVEKLGLK